jgi:hypothetical protein
MGLPQTSERSTALGKFNGAVEFPVNVAHVISRWYRAKQAASRAMKGPTGLDEINADDQIR